MDLGVWEGMLSEEINAKYSAALAERRRKPFHTRAPNGESPRVVMERVFAAVNEITERHRDESILIVSHGIALAIMICRTESFRMEEIYQRIPDPAQPYRAQWNP